MDLLLALLFIVGLVALIYWLLPSSPKKIRQAQTKWRGPIDEQRLTNSLLTVLILTLSGHDHR